MRAPKYDGILAGSDCQLRTTPMPLRTAVCRHHTTEPRGAEYSGGRFSDFEPLESQNGHSNMRAALWQEHTSEHQNGGYWFGISADAAVTSQSSCHAEILEHVNAEATPRT